MNTRFAIASCVVVFGLVASCGGSESTIEPGADASTNDGSTSGNDGGGNDALVGLDTSVGDALADAPGDAPSNQDGGDAGNCPNVFGRYSAITAVGPGCGNLNTLAPQCIAGTNTVCAAHFVSVVDAGTAAVNGLGNLTPVGTFSSANLYFGTAARSGCSGSWNSSSSTMQVQCGGGGDLCTVTMTRVATTCP